MVVKATQVFIRYVLIFGMELGCAVHSANINDFKQYDLYGQLMHSMSIDIYGFFFNRFT